MRQPEKHASFWIIGAFVISIMGVLTHYVTDLPTQSASVIWAILYYLIAVPIYNKIGIKEEESKTCPKCHQPISDGKLGKLCTNCGYQFFKK